MRFFLPVSDLLFTPDDEPPALQSDVLVHGAQHPVMPGIVAAPPDGPDAAAAPDTIPESAFAPLPDSPASPSAPPLPAATPAFALPPEDAFPTRAELDAILAAHAGPPASPDAAERAAAAALLGLDPAIAEDPALYDAAIAALPEPDADAVLAIWISEAVTGEWPLG